MTGTSYRAALALWAALLCISVLTAAHAGAQRTLVCAAFIPA